MSRKEFNYQQEFGNSCPNRIIYDIKELIEITKKNEGKVENNLDFDKLFNEKDYRNKVFLICYLSNYACNTGNKIKTYISNSIRVGSLIKKRNNEVFTNDEYIGYQDISLKQYRKLERFVK